MDINVFKIKVSKEEAVKKARGVRSTLMTLTNKEISEVRMHYIEVKFVTCRLTHKPNFIEKYIFKDREIKKQKILMMADGTTCETSLVDSLPDIGSVRDVDEECIQLSSYSDEQIVKSCKRVASRIVSRKIGSLPEVEVEKIESCFRPYWLIFYGNEHKSKIARCIPICADGCGTYRNF